MTPCPSCGHPVDIDGCGYHLCDECVDGSGLLDALEDLARRFQREARSDMDRQVGSELEKLAIQYLKYRFPDITIEGD